LHANEQKSARRSQELAAYAGQVTDGDEAAAALLRADEAWAAGELDGVVVHLSAAVRAHTADGDNRAAAMACARLGDVFHTYMANRTAARPWFTRAERLVADEEPCIEQGWVALLLIGCDFDDPADLKARAELALDRARRFGDTGLELKALADGGLARVQAGDVDEGMAMLDEAMALASGGATENADAIGKSVCSFYTACWYAVDYERAASWTDVFHRRGIVGPSPGVPAFLLSHCDSVKGVLLCHVGRWTEAEEVLVGAYSAVEEAMPGMAWHPPIALAELRILQGRLDEAEALLVGKDDHIQALLPTARLYLARGQLDLARAAAQRGLRLMASDRVRAPMLLGVLVEVELGRGDVERAAEAMADLYARGEGLGLPVLTGEAARLRARVLAARGDDEPAAECLREGLAHLAGANLPLLTMNLHLELARLLEKADPASALLDARAAAALLSRLDVVLAPADRDLLDRVGVATDQPRQEAECRVAVLTRDDGWWTATCGDTKVRLRDTKGLRYLAGLVARPGTERHVIDLVDEADGLSPEGLDRRQLGHAGPHADAQTRNVYRRRVVALRDQIEDALAVEDDERAAALQTELDTVVAELARSFGLGGRDRWASSAAEKARLNVTRALRSALAKLTEALPDAGSVLDRRVRTGAFCAYQPHPDDEVTWSVQS
jgi:tetratricopeptide (TPR) repeat protein